MALMPEDLQNKRFTPVRFSEGYDMEEVDSYLDDDVIPRLQELIDENERLQRELEEARNRISELESQDHEVDDGTVDASAAADGLEPAGEEPVVADDEVVSEEVVEEPVTTTEDVPVAPTTEPDQSAAGILALAHRLHDEHVKNGEDERDRLIAEATAESRRIVGEAEETSRTTLENLDSQKSELENTIDSLRTFERDYRNRLRNYLETQLRDLDTSETQDKQANFGL
ncbi:MAG: DivIVA domain-containing protein [Brachybacterium sp.]|nr:DivIVA domain-containing protein [Brachybacterium sp.]